MDSSTIIERIASAYGQHSRGFSKSFSEVRIPCPAHNGKHPNCAVYHDAGRISAVCYSRGCHPRDILAAIEIRLGIERLNDRDAWQPLPDAFRERREQCAAWDALVAAVSADQGAPLPFPTEPPSATPLADLARWERANPDSPYRPSPRTDFLPRWALAALEDAQEVTA